MNFALPAAVWVALSWRGGLYPWQQALAALLLAALLWRERSRLPSWNGLGAIERVLVLLLVAAGCETALSLRPQTTLNAVAGLGLALTAAMLIRRQAQPLAPRVAALLMYGGAAFAAAFLGWGFLAWGFHWGLSDSVTVARIFFPNQNLLAAGLALPALLLGLTGLESPSRRKFLPGLCSGLGALALVYAGSRGAYFALCAAFLWILLRWPQDRLRMAVRLGAVLMAVSALALWAPFSRLALRMKTQATPGLQDVNYYRRMDFWVGAAKLSAQRPLMGHGLGCFGAAALGLDLPTPLTPQEPIARYRLSLDHAHNEWLELAVETGWPVTLILFICTLNWKRRRWNSTRPSPEILGLEAVLIAAGTLSLVDMNLRTPALAWGLILCFCAIEAIPPPDSSASTASKTGGPGQGNFALIVAVLAVFCLLGAAIGNGVKRHHDFGRAGEMQGLAAMLMQPLDSGLLASEWNVPPWPWAAWAGRQDPYWWWNEGERSQDPTVQEADGRRAVALMPYFAPLRYMLGLKLAQDGKSSEAARDMAQALSLEPNFCAVLAWQADQALARGDKAAARKLIARVFAVRALKADSPDGYTAYIQSVDPSWLASHQLFTR